jgi:hypothetical protein
MWVHKILWEPRLVAHTRDPSTQEDCEFKANLGYILRLCQKNENIALPIFLHIVYSCFHLHWLSEYWQQKLVASVISRTLRWPPRFLALDVSCLNEFLLINTAQCLTLGSMPDTECWLVVPSLSFVGIYICSIPFCCHLSDLASWFLDLPPSSNIAPSWILTSLSSQSTLLLILSFLLQWLLGLHDLNTIFSLSCCPDGFSLVHPVTSFLSSKSG